jgi:hypothetical protein
MIRRATNCYAPALLSYVFLKSLLLVGGAGGYVGKGEHFPVLRSKTGEAQPFGCKPIVHISMGT